MNSFLLTGFVLSMFLVLALCTVLFGRYIRRQYGIQLRAVRWIAVFLAILGAIAAVFVLSTDYRMRVTTLHEEIVPGTLGMAAGVLATTYEVHFTVEHAGVEHTLFISPLIGSGIDAQFDVDVSCRINDPRGRAILDVVHTFKPGNPRSRMTTIRDWESMTWPFTPEMPGLYVVAVSPLTLQIPALHVRIVDPSKRDGKRMAGY